MHSNLIQKAIIRDQTHLTRFSESPKNQESQTPRWFKLKSRLIYSQSLALWSGTKVSESEQRNKKPTHLAHLDSDSVAFTEESWGGEMGMRFTAFVREFLHPDGDGENYSPDGTRCVWGFCVQPCGATRCCGGCTCRGGGSTMSDRWWCFRVGGWVGGGDCVFWVWRSSLWC